MNNLKNVGIYLRISKKDNRNSIQNQREVILNFLLNYQYTSLIEYIDDGKTGTNINRLALKKMLLDVKNKKIDTVIVKDVSRLGRNYSMVGFLIENYFPQHNIKFISVTENADIIAFKNIFNELYSKDLSLKIKASLKIKKLNGEYISNAASYGFQKEEGKLTINLSQASIIKKIFSLSLIGINKKKIAEWLNYNNILTPSCYRNHLNSKNSKTWNAKMVERILKNKIYMGKLTYNQAKEKYNSQKRIYIKNGITISVPAIITPKIFEIVNNKIIFICKKCHCKMIKKNNKLFCPNHQSTYKLEDILKAIEKFYKKKYHLLTFDKKVNNDKKNRKKYLNCDIIKTDARETVINYLESIDIRQLICSVNKNYLLTKLIKTIYLQGDLLIISYKM